MIVIIDYGMGNLGSIANMLKKIGARVIISSDPAVIESADKLILPGVGSFGNGMRCLAERDLIQLLNKTVLEAKKPILGLCLGMQLFTKSSEEGGLSGLGWLNAETVRFKFDGNNQKLKVPHMGWNTIEPAQPHCLFTGMDPGMRFYFVHSYHVVCEDQSNILARANYGFDFAAMVVQENIIGAQFHPEKSHKFGMQLLTNFMELV
jgi:imidazole glycerol-phosphate synthase subunit HisH